MLLQLYIDIEIFLISRFHCCPGSFLAFGAGVLKQIPRWHSKIRFMWLYKKDVHFWNWNPWTLNWSTSAITHGIARQKFVASWLYDVIHLRNRKIFFIYIYIDAALNSIFHNLEFISQQVHFLDAKIGAANRKTTGKKP